MARKPVDDDDDDEDDLDDERGAAGDDPAPQADTAGEDDGAEGDYEEEPEERSGGLGRLIIFAGIGLAFIIGVAAGGYFFFMRGDEADAVAGGQPAVSEDGTAMAITRRRMLTAEELAKGGTPGAETETAAVTPRAAPSPAAPQGAFTPPPSPQAQPATPPPAAEPQAKAQAAPQATPTPQATPKGAKGKAAPAAQGEPSGAGLVMPAVTAAAYRDIPVLPQGKPLTGPIASLIESTETGQLPRAQGSQGPWRAYARPFEGPADRPKIAIIVTGLGLSRAATLSAINQLPGAITLAFDPYARNTDEWVGVGRSNGHEALIHLPLEANDFPVSDPGPLALLTDLDAPQNLSRLHQILASSVGYVGLLQVMGSRFASSEAAMRPMLEETKRRGLLFVSVPANNDDRGMAISQEIALPVAQADFKIDTVASATAIDARLSELEKIARERGSAIGLAEAYPVTVAKLATWAQTLDFKELVLAPVSAVAAANEPTPAAATKGGAKGAKK